MALVDCPGCGRKIMSVASTCPHCSFLLTEHRRREERRKSMRRCGTCGGEIPPAASSCPKCGSPRVTSSRATWFVVGGAAGAAGLLAAGVLLLSGDSGQRPPPRTQSGPDTQAVAAAAPSPETVDSTPPTQPEPTPPAPAVTAPPSTVMRWTSTWVNVRDSRSPDAPVVRILTPGQQVAVGDYEAGWWAVYIDDERIGYSANSLLSPDPPDTTTERDGP